MAIGFFIGTVFILCQQMLIIFAIFIEKSKDSSLPSIEIQVFQAMAAFAFLLFFSFSTFGILLTVFRDDIIKSKSSINSICYFAVSHSQLLKQKNSVKIINFKIVL
jgi:hypothetical protein